MIATQLEIEKGMAGSQGDTSGVSQDFLGTFLSWTQDKNAAGCIFIGPPGSGKSAVAKSMGTECECPTIAFDMNGMKASLVGESGARLRSALSVVESIGQGSVLVLATCNSIHNLPPELRRRFTLGTFFFDLLSTEERKMVWDIYLNRYQIDAEQLEMVDDGGWTGAEIRQCCDIADRLGCDLVEASRYIVPVAKSAAEQIEALRKMASGKFLSASADGLYRFEVQQAPTRRRIG